MEVETNDLPRLDGICRQNFQVASFRPMLELADCIYEYTVVIRDSKFAVQMLRL